MKFILPLLFLLLCTGAALPAAEYSWIVSDASGTHSPKAEEDGSIKVLSQMPGNLLLYRSAKRETFAPDKAAFAAGKLEFNVHVSGSQTTLKAWIFAKDKDGCWFQSEKEYALPPDADAVLELPLDDPGAMLPIGHGGVWNASSAAAMFEFGITVFSDDAAEITLTCRPPVFTGPRRRPPLKILDWSLPVKTECETMTESRFQLSREYFNPFDPDEIQVDYELMTSDPDAAPQKFPAFYAQDFSRLLHFAQETVRPDGAPYWAFRFAPHESGSLKVRITALDRSNPEHPEQASSEWRTIEISPAPDRHGSIRVSEKDCRYFEFTDGTFYYPVGLNIHANSDFRSEIHFPWHHVPDRGSFDYEDYFNQCGRYGIDLVEIWMASWTCAIEWTSAMEYYYGAGRYNQANAWRLDRMFETAARNGININLVLDSHGKLTKSVDPEWNQNPFNNQSPFKTADGAFLDTPAKYWTDPAAVKMDRRRTRYIAARWGAHPNLFAYEFMSEINLVENAGEMLGNGVFKKWSEDAVAYLKTVDQGEHLTAMHVSGDAGTNVSWRKLFELPQYTHVVGDAYRSTDVYFIDQLRIQQQSLSIFSNKPVFATEFGEASTCLSDIHAGLWGAPFFNQAASPCLWWHDDIFIGKHASQYAAFAKFIRGVDLRDARPAVESMTASAILPTGASRLSDPARTNSGQPLTDTFYLRDGHPEFDLFGITKPGASGLPMFSMILPYFGAIGWIYEEKSLIRPPEDPASARRVSGLMLDAPAGLTPGRYRLSFHNTWDGNVLSDEIIEIKPDEPRLKLMAPPFRLDTAFKLERLSPVPLFSMEPAR